ncbi:hypothetical protein EMPG_14947 [Blastomyces silverae]|uniref:Uncharacterized protein n=1 Tax=Blastomyces silverae TaxID=2060906 RepID=A0A0H1BKB8_9EURO|nr:hypothetical protein EMPG_14947 [Blastomyces silverae]
MDFDFDNDDLKWENSPGLSHGCGVCGTNLNSLKAKKTCYGIHIEVCMRYHRTMFLVGGAHKCDSYARPIHKVGPLAFGLHKLTAKRCRCLMSNEQHQKRHREIATIIQEIQTLETNDDTTSTRKFKRTKKIANGQEHNTNSAAGDASWTKEENSDKDNSGKPVPKLLPALRRLQKQKAKIDRVSSQQRKSRFTFRSTIVLRSRLVEMGAAIHRSKICPTMTPEIALGALLSSIKLSQELKSELEKLSSQTKKRKGDGLLSAHRRLGYIQEVMETLGVPPPHTAEISKGGQILLDRVALAIFEDIQIVGNESRETLRRMLSYWRFASKKAYHAMVQNNQIVNWETGERLETQENSNGQEDK